MSYSSETRVFGLPQWQMSDIISMLDFNNAFLAIDNKAVPNTRKVNEKALTEDITLLPSDIGAVPTTRKINNKALATDISLTASDVGAVPTTRTVNGKPLSENVILTYNDVGAVSKTTTINGQPLEGNVVINVESNFLAAYPVGALFFTTIPTNPGTLYGGTWAAWGGGRTPVGVNTADTDFKTVEKTGGEKTHTLTVDETAPHSHIETVYWNAGGSGTAHPAAIEAGDPRKYGGLVARTENTGGGQAHNNLQPYITCYIWKRTT